MHQKRTVAGPAKAHRPAAPGGCRQGSGHVPGWSSHPAGFSVGGCDLDSRSECCVHLQIDYDWRSSPNGPVCMSCQRSKMLLYLRMVLPSSRAPPPHLQISGAPDSMDHAPVGQIAYRKSARKTLEKARTWSESTANHPPKKTLFARRAFVAEWRSRMLAHVSPLLPASAPAFVSALCLGVLGFQGQQVGGGDTAVNATPSLPRRDPVRQLVTHVRARCELFQLVCCAFGSPTAPPNRHVNLSRCSGLPGAAG